MPSSSSGIECIRLVRRYGDGVVLDGLDLRVERNSLLALMGANGAGKSTLLRILATLLLPDGGSATVLGADVVGDPMAARRATGYLPPEERSFHGRLTVRHNLEFFGALRGLERRAAAARGLDLLARLGLERCLDQRFDDLSSGMKQGVCLARALLHAPPVLLLDEPTRSLSPEATRGAWDLLKDAARKGAAVLLATHDPEEAAALGDAVLHLERGRVHAGARP